MQKHRDKPRIALVFVDRETPARLKSAGFAKAGVFQY